MTDDACLVRTFTYALAPITRRGRVVGTSLARWDDTTDPTHSSCPDPACPVRAGASGSEHTGADAQRPGRTTALPTTDPDHAPGRLTYDPATGAGRKEEP